MDKLNLTDFLAGTVNNFSINFRKVENGLIVNVNTGTMGSKEYAFTGTEEEIKTALTTFGLGAFLA